MSAAITRFLPRRSPAPPDEPPKWAALLEAIVLTRLAGGVTRLARWLADSAAN
jgi:hypothetical protein